MTGSIKKFCNFNEFCLVCRNVLKYPLFTAIYSTTVSSFPNYMQATTEGE